MNSTHRAWFVGSVLAAALVVPARAQSINLLQNGGFESGDLTGWTLELPGAANAGVNTIYPASGSYAILYHAGNPSTSGSILSQQFVTVPNATYSLSFDLGAYAAAEDQQLQVTVKGITTVFSFLAIATPGTGSGSGSYTHYDFPFVADAAATTLTLTDVTVADDEMDGLLDNVMVTQTAVPEPGTAALAAGLALGGFAAWRRMRRTPAA